MTRDSRLDGGERTKVEISGSLIHPQYRELVKERMATVLTHDKPVPSVEERIIRFDGTVVDV